MNKQQEGYDLEKRIHDVLLKTNLIIYNENDIIKKYGKICYGIDHLVYYNDIIIGIQDKWRDSKPNLSDINHFIKSIERISKFENIKCIGIYMSKCPLTQGATNSFDYENINSSNKFFTLHHIHKEILIRKLIELFYENNIYLYESDGSSIMIEVLNEDELNI